MISDNGDSDNVESRKFHQKIISNATWYMYINFGHYLFITLFESPSTPIRILLRDPRLIVMLKKEAIPCSMSS